MAKENNAFSENLTINIIIYVIFSKRKTGKNLNTKKLLEPSSPRMK